MLETVVYIFGLSSNDVVVVVDVSMPLDPICDESTIFQCAHKSVHEKNEKGQNNFSNLNSKKQSYLA